jgi:outer membrane murein-binding lipoprotein Lpp
VSLDGLRAWIGLVERKLTMRTRVFLVLVAIAVGGAAAAVYLSIDAQSNQVSEGDLQTLQTELTTRIETLETKVAALEGEVHAK